MCAALLALVHGGAALLVPVPPSAPLVRAVAVAPAAASAVSYPSPFPASSVTLTIASEEAPVKGLGIGLESGWSDSNPVGVGPHPDDEGSPNPVHPCDHRRL